MLAIKDLKKKYVTASNEIPALRGIDLTFRDREFVSILGPSGCGKTTLLSIIGGLDTATSGEVVYNGISTNDFSEADWNLYRNSKLGFVFQSYNLIQHLSVRENIELTLNLSGKSPKEYNNQVRDLLKKFDLIQLADKKVNQLSGGQAQKVAIVRAIANDAEIILADEPTSALDSELSEQVMTFLQKVAEDRLVVMVTHNEDLAERFSSRVIRMKDGKILSDSDPYVQETPKTDGKKVSGKKKTPHVGFLTAIKIGLKNLIYKKKRTLLTSIACSVGIIGLGLVLSFFNGVNIFMKNMQEGLLSSFPINIYEYSVDYSVFMDVFRSFDMGKQDADAFPDDKNVRFVDSGDSGGVMGQLLEKAIDSVEMNDISEDFLTYMERMDTSWYDAMYLYYGIQMNLLVKTSEGEYLDVSPDEVKTTVLNIATSVFGEKGLEKAYWNQLVSENEFMQKHYDLLEGRWPQGKEDLILVVNEKNELELNALKNFGFDVEHADLNGDGNITFDELLSDRSGFELRFVTNDHYYEETGETLSKYPDIKTFAAKQPSEDVYNSEDAVSLRICGVLRPKKGSNVNIVGSNLCYTEELTRYAMEKAKTSAVTSEQRKLCDYEKDDVKENETYTVIRGKNSVSDRYVSNSIIGLMAASLDKTAYLKSIGVDTTPVYISIYADTFADKSHINAYIDAWEGSIDYFDITEMVMYNVEIVINISFYVLVILSVISLIVSAIMMGIVTGNSVSERTREIGILRSLGARKQDVLHIFLSELLIIGLTGGILGIAISYALSPLLSRIIDLLCGISHLSIVNPIHAVCLVALSTFLAVFSGLFPAKKAANKKIVDSIRLE